MLFSKTWTARLWRRVSAGVSLCRQGDIAEQEGDSQSQGSATWLVDPKESKRTISTKYETTIFWVDLSSPALIPPHPTRPVGLALPHSPSFLPPVVCLSLWHSGPDPPCSPPLPSQPPPAFPAENYTAFPTLAQHFPKIYINTTFKLSNLLLLTPFFFLVYFVCLSNAVHSAFPFTITSHYWLTVISSLYLLHFFPPRCFSCSIRRRPRWGFSLWSFNRWLFRVLRKSESLRPKVSRSAHPLPGRTCSLGTAAVRELLVL